MTDIFCGSASLEAMCCALRCGVMAELVSTHPSEFHENTLGLLVRMRVWLQLIFGGLCGRGVRVQPMSIIAERPLNRKAERRSKHGAALGRCTYALGHILLRRYGYARFVQWLCNHTLVGRVERCFTPRRFWGARDRVAGCDISPKKSRDCHPPLRPD